MKWGVSRNLTDSPRKESPLYPDSDCPTLFYLGPCLVFVESIPVVRVTSSLVLDVLPFPISIIIPPPLTLFSGTPLFPTAVLCIVDIKSIYYICGTHELITALPEFLYIQENTSQINQHGP